MGEAVQVDKNRTKDSFGESILIFVLHSLSRRASALLNESTKKQRFRAIRICYFGIFVSSIVFSITISSLWPFLQIVNSFSLVD